MNGQQALLRLLTRAALQQSVAVRRSRNRPTRGRVLGALDLAHAKARSLSRYRYPFFEADLGLVVVGVGENDIAFSKVGVEDS